MKFVVDKDLVKETIQNYTTSDNKILITFAPEAALLNTASKCFKPQQQELKDMLTPFCAVKHGVGMYRNSLYECGHIKE